jgi:hypothetical protein
LDKAQAAPVVRLALFLGVGLAVKMVMLVDLFMVVVVAGITGLPVEAQFVLFGVQAVRFRQQTRAMCK